MKKYIVTFGCSHVLEGFAQVIWAESEEFARKIVNYFYGDGWSMLYTESQWISFEQNENRMYKLETLLSTELSQNLINWR